MLNPSRDASQWWDVTKLKKYHWCSSSPKQRGRIKLQVEMLGTLDSKNQHTLNLLFLSSISSYFKQFSLSFKDIVHKM